MPGVAWEAYGDLARDPDMDHPPVLVGRGNAVLDLDQRGAIVEARIDGDLFPPVTPCTATLPRPTIEHAVVGAVLPMPAGQSSTAVVHPALSDVRSVVRTVLHLNPTTISHDALVGLVYDVLVERGRLQWEVWIDPLSGSVIAVKTRFAID